MSVYIQQAPTEQTITPDTRTLYYTAGYEECQQFNRPPLLVPVLMREGRHHQRAFYELLCQRPAERAAYDAGWHAAMAGVLFPREDGVR